MNELESRIEALEALAPRCEVRGCGKIARKLCAEHEASWRKYQAEHPYEKSEQFIGRWENVREGWYKHFDYRDFLELAEKDLAKAAG
jgi:hypothetical protein